MPSVTLWRDRLFFLLGLTKGKTSFSPADVYSETVYHDLVRSEFMRSERSGYLCRIMLVYQTNTQGRVMPFRSDLAHKTNSVLSSSCRDTDYIGWYRQGRILGVLLTALRPDSAGDEYDNLKARMVDGLRGTLTFTDDQSLQVRMLEQSELTAFNAPDHSASFPGSTD